MSTPDEVVGILETCSMCGSEVPLSESIRFGDALVCIACKPLMLQGVREGVPDDAVRLHRKHPELASLVGPRSLYYLRKFERLQERPWHVSWNWPACFLTSSWLIYRKMYFAGGLLILAELCHSFLQDLLDLPDPFFWGFTGLELVFVGCWGNWLYRRECQRILQQLAPLPLGPEKRALQLRQRGGVNLRLALFISLVTAALSFGISWWLNPESLPWAAGER